jgi:hypothetical protein
LTAKSLIALHIFDIFNGASKVLDSVPQGAEVANMIENVTKVIKIPNLKHQISIFNDRSRTEQSETIFHDSGVRFSLDLGFGI